MEDNEVKFEFVSSLTNTENYKLPERSTKNSAGYDFYSISEETLQPGEIRIIKTGIKSKFPVDTCLLLLNRSSNASKKGLVLMNGIGLIDADYYNNKDNEGEIGFMFKNIKEEPVTIKIGDKLGQGLFIRYATITHEKEITTDRVSGWGSTGV